MVVVGGTINVQRSVHVLNYAWVIKQDKDLKHNSKSTTEWLKKILWHNLIQTICAWRPSSVAELNQFYKHMFAVLAAEGGTTSN